MNFLGLRENRPVTSFGFFSILVSVLALAAYFVGIASWERASLCLVVLFLANYIVLSDERNFLLHGRKGNEEV